MLKQFIVYYSNVACPLSPAVFLVTPGVVVTGMVAVTPPVVTRTPVPREEARGDERNHVSQSGKNLGLSQRGSDVKTMMVSTTEWYCRVQVYVY